MGTPKWFNDVFENAQEAGIKEYMKRTGANRAEAEKVMNGISLLLGVPALCSSQEEMDKPAQGIPAKVYHDFVSGTVSIEIDGGINVYCTPLNTMHTGIGENGKHIYNQEKVKINQIFITEEALVEIARYQKQADGTGRLIFDITGD